MSTWSSANLEIDGHPIHYTRTGGDKPPLVLLHGFSDNGRCWIRAAQALETSYDLIMPDARGHGLSARIDVGVPFNSAVDIAGLIQTLGLDKPALMGHSMGAATAARVTARYPNLVGVLLLEDPPWFEPEPEPIAGQTESDDEEPGDRWQWIKKLWAKSKTEIIATGKTDNPAWADIEFEAWAEAKLQLDRNIVNMPFQRDDWRELAASLSCPTLLITGDPEQNALVTAASAQTFSKLCSGGSVAHISGAGHNIRREQFEPFLEAVTQFLAEHYN